MPVDELLVQAALEQADRRWPDKDAVAAAVRLEDGGILTGVPLSNFNAAMTLCAETGPVCAAYSAGRKVVASVCVLRDRSSDRITVLAPCGACKERLAFWGPDVEVGVADSTSATGWSSRRLLDVNPFYWAASSTPGDSWPTPADHEW